jgi:hypothetical protein
MNDCIKVTEYNKFMTGLRLHHDICLVGFGVKWNSACWQTWNALWRYQEHLDQLENNQSQPSAGSTLPTPVLQKQKSNVARKSVKIVLIDEEEIMVRSDLPEGASG